MPKKPDIINKIGTVPNTNYTPSDGRDIKGIVNHWIVGTAESALRTFADPNRKASAHFVIDDEGRIYQLLHLKDVAWHAGDYQYNKKTIGIEHEGGYQGYNGNTVSPTRACEKASAELQAWLADEYGLGKLEYKKNIWRHKDISPTSCPGSLDISYIISQANDILNNNNKKNMSEDIKNQLIEATEKAYEQEIINEKTKDLNINALHQGDYEYFANFSGYTVRKWHKELKKANEELKKKGEELEDKLGDKGEQVNIKKKLEELDSRVEELEANIDALNKAV